MKTIHVFGIVVVGLMTLACGGGGGSSRSTPPATVTPAPVQPTITITNGGLLVGIVNEPYQDTIAVTVSTGGGSSLTAQGSLPAGLSFNNGVVQGTPTQVGNFPVTFVATSTTTSTLTTSKVLNIQIVNVGSVRNDSLVNATQLACCSTIRASLSPYSRAAGFGGPDNDWYRITANAGDRISVETSAIGTEVDTDTVIEITDVTGLRMSVCKTPQLTAAFNQACINDDISRGVIRGSHLDVQLPPTSGVFFVRVFDYLGRARPEMTYELRMAKLP